MDWRGANEINMVGVGAERSDLGELSGDWRHCQGAQVNGHQRCRAVARIAADQPLHRCKGVARLAKAPLRRAELCRQWVDRFDCTVGAERVTGDAVEVPPSAAVGDKIKGAV